VSFDNVIIVEDLVENFYPLSLSTPIPNMIIGGLRYFEHVILNLLGLNYEVNKIYIVTRKHLAIPWLKLIPSLLNHLDLKFDVNYTSIDKVREICGKSLIVSSLLLPNKSIFKKLLEKIRHGEVIAYADKPLMGILNDVNAFWSKTLWKSSENISIIEGVWDLIKYNTSVMEENLELVLRVAGLEKINNNVYKTLNATIHSYVDFSDKKPIVIIDSEIDSFTKVEGPTILGPKVHIHSCTLIRSGTSIYFKADIGGELKNVIIDAYSNKAHNGYVGDSYVGRWVNIGAGTNVSNLKNTRGVIKYRGRHTGMEKLGAIISDWVKVGIGTNIYCGRYIGQASHVLGYVIHDVPPFTIYAKPFRNDMYELNLDKAIEIFKRYCRSKVEYSNYEIKVMKYVYELSLSERQNVRREYFSLY